MYTNINFNDIRKYLNEKKFPEDVSERGKKANFKRQCKNFEIVDNKLMYCKRGIGKVRKIYFVERSFSII